MWRLASSGAGIAATVIFAVSGLASSADTPTPSPEASPSASPAASPSPEPTPDPTPEPLPPAPSPGPVDSKPYTPPSATIDPAYPGALRPGDWVQIAGTGTCLNMRWEPRIPAASPDHGAAYDNVINCLPDGFIGRLDASGWSSATLPVSNDGRWWWHIIGQGWAAEEWLAFHHQGGIPWPERPDLSGSGLIAYIGKDNGIWLMNADGSNPRRIVPAEPDQWVQTFQWSLRGDRLGYSISRPDGTMATRVADLNGATLLEIAGLSAPRWSPNGGHLAGVRSTTPGPSGILATPVVLDLATGAEWPVGPATHGYEAPIWSPDGASLAFVCRSGYLSQQDGASVMDETRNCHGDGLRTVSVDGSNTRILLPQALLDGGYFYGPAWSPTGQTIVVTSMRQGDGCNGYVLVDVQTAVAAGCISPPGMASTVSGGCGGPGMSNAEWTADSRVVFSAPGAGNSGVFVHDPASGAQTFIPSMSAYQISLAPDGLNVTYAASGFLWVAGLDGSNLTLLSEGHSPAWQPQP